MKGYFKVHSKIVVKNYLTIGTCCQGIAQSTDLQALSSGRRDRSVLWKRPVTATNDIFHYKVREKYFFSAFLNYQFKFHFIKLSGINLNGFNMFHLFIDNKNDNRFTEIILINLFHNSIITYER